MTRILVVEDDAVRADGLETTLELEGYDGATAPDGATGVRHVVEWRPDLIVLNVRSTGLDGFCVLRDVRRDRFTGPVLVLTAKDAEADEVLGLERDAEDGATTYVGRMELAARVEGLLRRTALPSAGAGIEGADGQLEGFGDVEIDPAARTVTRRGREVALTPKEFDLLLALVRRRGRAASRRELLTEVWGYAETIVTRTVDTHVLELRRKLEDEPAAPRHLVTVRTVGYRVAV